MGNSTSSERPPRTPHKLSKPRIGKPTSSTSPAPDNSTRFSQPYFIAPPPDGTCTHTPPGPAFAHNNSAPARDEGEEIHNGVAEIASAARGAGAKREGNLWRSKSSTADAGSRRERKELENRSITNRLSRQSSMASMGESAYLRPESDVKEQKRASLNYDLSSYQARRLLNAEEGHEAGCPGGVQSGYSEPLQVSQSAWKSNQPSPNLTIQVVRSASEKSLYSPTRRRSLLQRPGVATRSETECRALSPATRANFRKSLPADPTDSSRSSIEIQLARRLSMPPLPRSFESREGVATPSELEYRQLGGMKFGSLRITNGAPAQTPPLDSAADGAPLASGQRGASNEYFDMDRAEVLGQEKPDSHRTKQPTWQEGVVAEKTISEGFAVGTPGLATQNVARPRYTEADTPNIRGEANESSHRESQFKSANGCGEPAHDHLAAEQQPRLAWGGNDRDIFLKPDWTVPKGLDLSPKSFKGVARSDSGLGSTASSQCSRKPLSKADSGYSSNVSLSSFSRSSSRRQDTESINTSIPSARESLERKDSAPSIDPLSTQSRPSISNEEDISPTGQRPSDLEIPSAKKEPTCVRSRPSLSTITGLRFPSLKANRNNDSVNSHSRNKSTGSATTITEDTEKRAPLEHVPTPSSSRSSRKHGKLYRILSGSQSKSVSTSYDSHGISRNVPSVPNDIEEKLHEHNGKFPTAPKRLTLKTQPSKETLKTIVSVESANVSSADLPVGHDVDRVSHSGARPLLKSLRGRSMQSVLPAWPVNSRRSLSHMTEAAARRALDEDIDDDDIPCGYFTESELQVPNRRRNRQSYGSSAFDQAVLAMAQAPAPRSASSLRDSFIPSSSHRPDRRRRHSLTSTASAPDCRGTQLSPICPSPELAHSLKKPRTPPPVSMRTRSGKRSKSSKHTAPSDAPPLPSRPLPPKRSHESLRNGVPSRRVLSPSAPAPRGVNPPVDPSYIVPIQGSTMRNRPSLPAKSFDEPSCQSLSYVELSSDKSFLQRKLSQASRDLQQRRPPAPSHIRMHDPWTGDRRARTQDLPRSNTMDTAHHSRPMVRSRHIHGPLGIA